MSRPNQGSSRPLGISPKPSTTPGGAPSVTIPRRSAGALPGIARTASSLRQGSPINPSGSSLASLPAHLRNLSAPKIPSPLGKGTPARQLKQSLPVRTSKTTERHVFLPEDPQLAPLPISPMGSRTDLAPPRRASTSSSATPHSYHDERSDAEKMTKRERDENHLPRLTAYNTADGYRLKLLQAFLKREHGVGVVRVFDDCIYAVYNLPLLPGYGASTKLRSSPALGSPGGVSLLERMTLAEDLGYNDSYFPVEENSHNHGHVHGQSHDPSEYILSNSPPHISPDGLRGSLGMHLGDGRQLEDGESHIDSNVSTAEEISGHGEDISSPSEEEEIVTGTHMSPEHPGYLEHIPSEALSPNDLNPDPAEVSVSENRRDQQLQVRVQDFVHTEYQRPRYPKPQMRRRRKSALTLAGKVAEAVFFSYGVSVFFGFQEGEEREIMEDCETAGAWLRGQKEEDWEVEEFHYVYDPDAEFPRIYNDMFTFKSHSHLFKLSIAHAVAQSTKLSIYEGVMQESLSLTSSFPKELSTTGHLQLGRRDALKMTGRLFKLRMDVNLIGGILDTPELFWSEASLFPLYEAIREYLEIGPRVQVLNDRLAVAGDLLEIIHEYIEERATHRITWIIIWLILVACVVEVGEVVARLIFHALQQKSGPLLVVKGSKAFISAIKPKAVL
ncbi:cytoplasmic protein [Tremella mesenterica]|uniref:Cytoplasmic protein n=1 Tax=Tremella mesenterica TaxID=5217 RepID=A0A4Q1BJJ2_TREME|nr:cytoplasmic protein [Tremella mesenterica]